MDSVCTADEALEKLREGNSRYLASDRGTGDISRPVRLKTSREGQHPFAVIIACSDSRVIPEAIFDAGIGDLFVIRVAGNVMDSHQLGSVEYAAEHLGCPLAVVMGHTQCGAVAAALEGGAAGWVKSITDVIREAAGEEKDPARASCLNAVHAAQTIRKSLNIPGLTVRAALCHIEDGRVEFLDA